MSVLLFQYRINGEKKIVTSQNGVQDNQLDSRVHLAFNTRLRVLLFHFLFLLRYLKQGTGVSEGVVSNYGTFTVICACQRFDAGRIYAPETHTEVETDLTERQLTRSVEDWITLHTGFELNSLHHRYVGYVMGNGLFNTRHFRGNILKYSQY